MRRLLPLAAACLALPAHAQDGTPPAGADPFELGQITVTAPRGSGLEVGSATLSAEALYVFDRARLDEAVSLIPGVTASGTGGVRNDRLIFVRGFDRFQVPLLIDGIRVYLPADNRLDFGRFLTPDTAEVQVAKGYASVMDGPGAMGGLVNLVTRKPSRPLEAEARTALILDRDGGYSGYSAFGLLGTAQERWYAQASFARARRDHFDLAGGFEPTPNENGGRRDLSRSEDWRLNAKLGLTPNATDEYTLSFTRQEGSKQAPIETTFPLPAQRFWDWPYWNVQSLAFFSTTALGGQTTLRTRAYYNSFDNLLRAYDNRSLTSQTLPRAFNSTYADDSWGGEARLALGRGEDGAVELAGFYRRDRHVEFQEVFPAGTTEPRQIAEEDVYSAAVEWRGRAAPDIFYRLGGSYDIRDLHGAQDFTGVPGQSTARFIEYQVRDGNGWNAQGELAWRPRAGTGLRALVSSRIRFPTLFERFSSRFGGFVSAPGLKAERATQVELGGATDVGPLRIEAAAHYARLSDVIISLPVLFYPCTNSTMPPPPPVPPTCAPQAVTQSDNATGGDYYGAELALTWRPARGLRLGATYGWTERELEDPARPAFRPVGVPTHKAFLWADWSPAARLSLYPSLEIASDRWLVNTAGTRWFRDGAYALAGLRVDYRLPGGVVIGAAARNLFEANYQLADGFPEEGRSFTLSARWLR